MLTDEELAAMISSRYGDVAMTVPLDDVQQRGDHRRLRGRVTSGVVIAAVVLLIGGATAWITSTTSTATMPAAARSVSNDCDRQYAKMIGARSDRKYLPVKLTTPIIDVGSDVAGFRLYLNLGVRNGVLFDCSHGTAGSPSAHLTVTPTDQLSGPEQAVPPDPYYQDYLPGGAGALVGRLDQPNAVTVRVTAADGTSIATVVAHGYFVAWSPVVDLDGATVRVYDQQNIVTATLHAPTMLSDTFENKPFLAICRQLLDERPGDGPYHGSHVPVLEDTNPRTNQAVAIYLGNVTASCNFDPIPGDENVGIITYPLEPAHATSYGWGAYLTGDGFITGWVPPDTTSVRVVGADGKSYPVKMVKGVFAALITKKLCESPGTKLIMKSPTGTQTYTSQISATF